ncbi:DedD protein [Lysobacter sp. A03]|nr:DedD protein [Lysobacter sp. A03]
MGFVVQLGAFGNPAEATALRDRARSQGLSAFVEQVRTADGTLNRVQVGPVADRAAADQLKAQAAAKLGISGFVRAHP